jgi:hypothetical protein
MLVEVQTIHFIEATSYSDIYNCPLAKAINDIVSKNVKVNVGGHNVVLGIDGVSVWYKIDGDNWSKASQIITWMDQAKKGYEIPTVIVSLTLL